MTEISKRRLLAGAALSAALWLRGPLALSQYSAWVIALPLILWCAAPFHEGLRRSFKNRRADSDMLVSVSVWAAFLFATVAVFIPEVLLPGVREPLFGTIAALVIFPSFGRWLEMRLTERSSEAVWKLTRRIPVTARVLRDGAETIVPCGQVLAADRVVVRPGEQVPLDGEVVEGNSRVDESLWTGDGAPVEKSAGSRVLGGSLNKDGTLTVSGPPGGQGTALSQLVAEVREGFSSKVPGPRLADRLAERYVPAVVIIAVVAALLWSWKGPEPRLQQAFTAFAFVLVAACPWSLGLAAPAALAVGMRRAARMGMRIRNPAVLQSLLRPDVVVVDKTGILTEGRPEVSEVLRFGEWKEGHLLRIALAAGRRSGHPYAEALLRRAPRAAALTVESVETYPRRGVSAVVDGSRVLVGSLSWLAEHGIEPTPRDLNDLLQRKEPLLALAIDGALAGIFFFRDPLRPGVADQVRALERMGVEVVLASGDRNAAVRHVAEAAGIRKVFTEVVEDEKVRVVAELQASGMKVAMVGEGFHDAPALSHADLGVALEADPGDEAEAGRRAPATRGFDLAAEAADLVLRRRDLGSLARAIRLGTEIRNVIGENLMWAFVLQVLLIPVAAGAFVPGFGAWFRPGYAAGAAAVSALIIVLNSIRRLRS
ncbi:MAG: heavy metal translocating P-type ATPase [Elusimicrobiota bacterium]